MIDYAIVAILPFSIGFQELAVIAVIAVLLFGSRLPEVARSVGQSYNQFKKGLNDIKSNLNAEIDMDLDSSDSDYSNTYNDVNDEYEESTVSGFDPPE